MDKVMHSDVADDILLKHFNLAKVKYPDESWKNFDDVVIEREFVTAAMIEFAEQENQSLRSELQKQKELNAELSKGLEEIVVRFNERLKRSGY